MKRQGLRHRRIVITDSAEPDDLIFHAFYKSLSAVHKEERENDPDPPTDM